MTESANSRLIYISGGSRSGKSRYAELRAVQLPGPRTYIATCPAIDDEMDERIARHRRQREKYDWLTLEEPLELARVLGECRDSSVVLVDCLTLWINNLLYRAQQSNKKITEKDIATLCTEVAVAASQGERTVIFVTNELGMGLVPADPVSRLYRDLVGRCNQTIVALADEAVFIVSGCPIFLKGDVK
ncbi:bifunctional adenosylcobinamide kinase/adenosylcobinamide-phosphate guanylyltransferase [Trichloromonas acetexigens]|jgi:adenosylcobinamide kinase/adenosylcobinamide-phosphate guanylyltransferase|uniref:Adenosylcobinamide kinase n=1 Tax=Trichloromonas acetexigens TaxID=38815 RepID=A0A550J3Y2_9BACT|nr:bifunctional adenosylcobinamide kinase/adenosylcobinamide-phosphate guanylyltransferase [Desulfuromonas acetexigens]TRO77833.1 bifunctional adenosylcobinamide kinase/adenosylcobinamide-phosphate guanylyltransferase [Desulfuromonas acetexigens]